MRHNDKRVIETIEFKCTGVTSKRYKAVMSLENVGGIEWFCAGCKSDVLSVQERTDQLGNGLLEFKTDITLVHGSII